MIAIHQSFEVLFKEQINGEKIMGHSISRRKVISSSVLAAAGLGAGQIISGCAVKKKGRKPPELGPYYPFYCTEAPEITEPGPLILPDGTGRCGWSRKPLLDINLEDARFYDVPYFQRYRHKKWEQYYVVTPDYYLTFIIAWIGFAAFCEVMVYDRATREKESVMKIKPPGPEIEMMRNPTGGITLFNSRQVSMVFDVDGDRRTIRAEAPGFAGKGFEGELELIHPVEDDSICGHHLMHPRRAYFGQKITCMKSGGWWKLGGQTHRLDPEQCVSMLDFGRGHYPPRKFWYWSISSGRAKDGGMVGWNLGHGNNPNETIENCVFYNGKIHKMTTPVEVEFVYDDLYKPWRIRTKDGRCGLTMVPETVSYTDLELGYLYAHGRPAWGLYHGFVILDDGKKVALENLFGIFEWVDQRW